MDQYVAEQQKRTRSFTWKTVVAFVLANAGAIALFLSFLTESATRRADAAAGKAIDILLKNYEAQEGGIQAILTSQVKVISAKSSTASEKLGLISFDLARITKSIGDAVKKRETLESLLTTIQSDAKSVGTELRNQATQIQIEIEQQSERLTVAKEQMSQLVREITALSKDEEAKKAFETMRILAATLKEGDATHQLLTLRSDLDIARSVLPPIGSIIAWHANLRAGELPTSPGDGRWVRCDGGTITDGPLKGQPIPDLNGERRFLRGGSLSGRTEDDALGRHTHRLRDSTALFLAESTTRIGAAPLARRHHEGHEPDPISWNTYENAGQYGEEETRPKNMSVVWIMRIR